MTAVPRAVAIRAIGVSGRMLRAVRASPTPGAPPPGISAHLVLGYRPGWQAPDDLQAIARHVADIEPSIQTFIVPTTHRNPVTTRRAARRPTLVVSAGRLPDFRPRRGKVYQGAPIGKLEQLRRLADCGVPVPRTETLTSSLVLDPADWGEFVLVKPSHLGSSSSGHGIQFIRTSRVRYMPPEAYPEARPGRWGPMLVQQFIDTGVHLTAYRVLTLFGEPLYAMLNRSHMTRIGLDRPDAEIEAAVIAMQGVGDRERHLIDDPDVLALARAAYAAVPEPPVHGVDILRDVHTGRAYVIELNCGGNTWHFSSAMSEPTRTKYGPEFEARKRRQFDAFRTAARVLVDVTEREAE